MKSFFDRFKGVFSVGNKLLSLLASIVSTGAIAYGGYMLYEAVYSQKAAFSSYDLLQYRPVIVEDKPTLGELKSLNDDVTAWIFVSDTHIDYPVLQGKDETEYASKNPYGEFSLTGSIYLSSYNSPDFSDAYNLIYGHHVDNGSMFGDLDLFLNEDFYKKHNSGYLILENIIYQMNFFGVVETSAYNWDFYKPNNVTMNNLDRQIQKIKDASTFFTDGIADGEHKLVALSTCHDADSYGRILLFGQLEEFNGTLDDIFVDIGENSIPKHEPQGHGVRYWALVNLLCIFVALYILLPFGYIKSKYKRRSTMKDVNEDSGHDFYKKLDRFQRKYILGIIGQVLCVVGAIVLFVLTENIRLPMTLTDKYTPYMVLLVIGAWAVDWLLIYNKDSKD